MKQAQVQSLLFAVVLAVAKTVTNLIPNCIIQRLFCSDNMNLCRGKARGGDLTDDWAKDGVEGRMMDGVYLCACGWERFLSFLGDFFNSIFYILLKRKNCWYLIFTLWSVFFTLVKKVISVTKAGFMLLQFWYVELGTLAHTEKCWPTSYRHLKTLKCRRSTIMQIQNGEENPKRWN